MATLRESAEPVTMPQTERQIAVRQALATLPPPVRETLERTFFEGMTAAEVAASMGVPEGTAKSRLARGLEHMQRVFRLLEIVRRNADEPVAHQFSAYLQGQIFLTEMNPVGRATQRYIDAVIDDQFAIVGSRQLASSLREVKEVSR